MKFLRFPSYKTSITLLFHKIWTEINQSNANIQRIIRQTSTFQKKLSKDISRYLPFSKRLSFTLQKSTKRKVKDHLLQRSLPCFETQLAKYAQLSEYQPQSRNEQKNTAKAIQRTATFYIFAMINISIVITIDREP